VSENPVPTRRSRPVVRRFVMVVMAAGLVVGGAVTAPSGPSAHGVLPHSSVHR
jgi:hypothetical protein